MRNLITRHKIETFSNRNLTIGEIDAIGDALDEINWNDIVKQKLAEKGIHDVMVDVEN